MRGLLTSLSLALAASCSAQCEPPTTILPSGPLSSTSSSPTAVNALIRYDDANGPALIAGGVFYVPGSTQEFSNQNIARYQNGRWSTFAPGMTQNITLLADADFSSLGGPVRSIYAATESNNVGRWTGNAWLFNSPGLSTIYTLLSTSDATGPVLLAAGGSAAPVRAFRGNTWSDYGANLTINSGRITQLRMMDDGSGPALYACGTFIDTIHNIRYIARLVNGAWQQYEYPNVGSVSSINDVIRFDDGSGFGVETYYTGQITIPNVTNANAARKRGGQWVSVGSGAWITTGGIPLWTIVSEPSGPALYLTGGLARIGAYSGVLKWGVTDWTVPINVYELQGASTAGTFNTGVIHFDDATWFFGGIYGHSLTYTNQSFQPAYGLVRIRDDGVHECAALGLGEPSASAPTGYRYDLAVADLGQGDRLIAAGPISRAGGQPCQGAAAFDGQNWTGLFSAGTTSSLTIQSPVMANIDGQNRLYAFIPNNGALGPVAYWSGTQWVRLSSQPPSAQTAKLIVYNNRLYYIISTGVYTYAPGFWNSIPPLIFQATTGVVANIGRGERMYISASGTSGPGVYEFDGTTATMIGGAVTMPTCLIAHTDPTATPSTTLYAAGNSFSGGAARLNANLQWTSFGANISGTPTSCVLASYDDGHGPALYIAGSFGAAGGIQSPGLIRYRNNQWSNPVPFVAGSGGLNNNLSAAVFQNKLYIAGNFSSIAGRNADHLLIIEPCPRTCTADYDNDGDTGTDFDIQAFFSCLGGDCCATCTADFNNDGDTGTDADIESFFRVLGGGPC